MEELKYRVYVKVDSNNVIAEINSSIFISDATGWIQIDEGTGDRYSHAQGMYLGKSLMDMTSKYNYKLVDGEPVELTEEEKEKLFTIQVSQPTADEILRAKLIKDNADIQLQLAQQQKLNADLLLKIAKLGGTINV
ncbi:hypothetical protein [Clostridium beijerinckii]|uniref:hypothetical protein n=1 Tax=Clostridium beijerinckii TaxID=1520 RepID=UPI001F3C1486|nr:hypothetical protein [Clostridium beijerinckii]